MTRHVLFSAENEILASFSGLFAAFDALEACPDKAPSDRQGGRNHPYLATDYGTNEERAVFRAPRTPNPSTPCSFADYGRAASVAREHANYYHRSFGIEKLGGEYRVFALPRPENRCGFELRCEVVDP